MSGYGELKAEDNSAKRPRARLACDACRKKKVRCDGADVPERRCTGCTTHKIPCTYETHNKRRAGDHPGSLDERLSKMESILDRVQPRIPAPQIHPEASGSPTPSSPPGTSQQQGGASSDDLEDSWIPELSQSFQNIDLSNPEQHFGMHYHGKSSGFIFMKQARLLKSKYTGVQEETGDTPLWKNRRPEFWGSMDPSPFVNRDPRQAEFPDDDLAEVLIQTFFEKCLVCSMLILRDTFEENWRSHVHLQDESIAALTLVVFAVASKFVRNEPRVASDPTNYRQAGNEYYEEVRSFYSRIQNPISLTQFQGLALSAYFQYLSSFHHAAWTSLGVAVRLGQDVGAHRRKPSRSPSTTETELWRRTFWSVMVLDVNISAGLGRPVACQFEDMDAEPPKPLVPYEEPHTTFFSCYVRLTNILNSCLRVLYSLKKPKMLLDLMGDEYEQNVVAELDSSLNEWIDSIPESLRWNPHCEDDVTLERSTLLYASYYNVQLMVHRPFIPQPNKPSRLSFPSLAICTNAARSCAHVLDVARRRNLRMMPIASFAAYSCALTLLIGTWGAKNCGVSLDYDMHVKDIDYCIKFLMSQEHGYSQAGKVVDIIKELASFGDLTLTNDIDTPQTVTLPPPSPNQGKRSRDGDDEPENILNGLSRSQWKSRPRSTDGSARGAMFLPYKQSPSPIPAGNAAQGPYNAVTQSGNLPYNTAALSQPPVLSHQPWWNPQPENPYRGCEMSAPANSYANYGTDGASPTSRLKSPDITSLFPAGALPSGEAYRNHNIVTRAQPEQPYLRDVNGSGIAQRENPFWGLVDQSQLVHHAPQTQPIMINKESAMLEGDALGLWSFAPSGFEWDSWDSMMDDLRLRT